MAQLCVVHPRLYTACIAMSVIDMHDPQDGFFSASVEAPKSCRMFEGSRRTLNRGNGNAARVYDKASHSWPIRPAGFLFRFIVNWSIRILGGSVNRTNFTAVMEELLKSRHLLISLNDTSKFSGTRCEVVRSSIVRPSTQFPLGCSVIEDIIDINFPELPIWVLLNLW